MKPLSNNEIFEMRRMFLLVGGSDQKPPSPPDDNNRRNEGPRRPVPQVIVGDSVLLNKEYEIADDCMGILATRAFKGRSEELRALLKTLKVDIEGEGLAAGQERRGYFQNPGAIFFEADLASMTKPVLNALKEQNFTVYNASHGLWLFPQNGPKPGNT